MLIYGCICWKAVNWHGLICCDTVSSGCNRQLHILGQLMVNWMGIQDGNDWENKEASWRF
jgi:hypothetical protein